MKNVRTKIKKTERIEIRCTKAFKENLNEIAVQNNMTISQVIESICTDRIKKNLKSEDLNLSISKQEKKSSSVVKGVKPRGDTRPISSSKRKAYEEEIWRMLQEGITPTETAKWLNENGFKPQRGDYFTMNSVHSIRKRLKRENNEK